MFPRVPFRPILAGLLAAVGPLATCAAEPAKSDLARQIALLSSEQFAVRQEATRALRAAGPQAIPELAAAIRTGDAEVRSRGFFLLESYAFDIEGDRCYPARAALSELAKADSLRVRTLATAILEAVEQRIIARLTELRAVVSPRQALSIAIRQNDNDSAALPGQDIVRLLGAPRSYWVQIGQGWRGHDSGLMLLADLGGVSRLSVENAPIADNCLVQIGALTDLERLYLGSSRIQGVGLKELAPLRQLRYLSLKQLPISDRHLAELPAFNQLTDLGLDYTQVGDDGLAHLTRYSHLTRLWLDGTNVTDAGIAQLRHLPELHTLYLASTRVSGPGLAELADSPALTFLSLKAVQFQPDGLQNVGTLLRLERLGLDDTNVADEQLADLAGLSRLRELWLNSTHITDAGLVHLRSLPSLQILHLSDSQVTTEGVNELQKALPRLSVTR